MSDGPTAAAKPMRSLSERVMHGATWMVLMQTIDRLLGVVSMVVLARLLVPADFGLVAMAMSIVGLIELLGAFNFDMALIQNQRAQRVEFDSAWTLNVILGSASGVLLLAAAAPAAAFYAEPRLTWMIAALAFAPMAGGFANIGVVAFRKELDFRREFSYMLTKRVLAFVTTITIALLLRNYWALVIGTLVGRTMGTGLSYLLHPYRPRFSLGAARAVLSFSGWLVTNNILYFALHKVADFVVGKSLGATALGLHTIAYEVANLPTTHMTAPVNRAVYPAYAKIASEPSALARAYLRVLAMVATLALPAGLGIAAVSDLLVKVALGERWQQAAPLIAVLAIAGSLSALQTNVGYVYTALGRPRRQTLFAVVYVCLLVPSILLGVRMLELQGVALAFLGVALVNAPFTFALLGRDLSISFRDYCRALLRPVIAAAAMYFSVRGFAGLEAFGGLWGDMARLAGAVSLGVLVYASAILSMWLLAGRPDGAEREVLDAARRMLRRGR